MINIILCILASASLIVIFKIVDRVKANLFPVIVVNYLTAAISGMVISGIVPNVQAAASSPWAGLAAVMGILFVTVFTFIGLSTQKSGITITAIAQKMSLVIPIIVAFNLYGDRITLLKVIGVILALAAILLTTYKKQEAGAAPSEKNLLVYTLPLLVFFGSGICDAGINYAQKMHLSGVSAEEFSIILFAVAFIAGLTFLCVQRFRGGYSLSLKEVGYGVLLGVPNYFSLYFLLQALNTGGMESSVVYPIINIGVVTTSALVAYLIFKEKLGPVNLAGICLAVAAIAVLSFG
jgi:drug/metabolite transporter (DMT)-like permease